MTKNSVVRMFGAMVAAGFAMALVALFSSTAFPHTRHHHYRHFDCSRPCHAMSGRDFTDRVRLVMDDQAHDPSLAPLAHAVSAPVSSPLPTCRIPAPLISRQDERFMAREWQGLALAGMRFSKRSRWKDATPGIYSVR